ncbi:hypothetical protein P9112_001901 [Eukaryota sp. TZLM1-RC]
MADAQIESQLSQALDRVRDLENSIEALPVASSTESDNSGAESDLIHPPPLTPSLLTIRNEHSPDPPSPKEPSTAIDQDFHSFIRAHQLSDDDSEEDEMFNEVRLRLSKLTTTKTSFSPKQRFKIAALSVYFSTLLQSLSSSSRSLLLSEISSLWLSFSDRSVLFYKRVLLYPLQAILEYPKKLLPEVSKALFFVKNKKFNNCVCKIQTRMTALISSLYDSKSSFVEQEKGLVKFLARLTYRRRHLPPSLFTSPYLEYLGLVEGTDKGEELSEVEVILVVMLFVNQSLVNLLLNPITSGVSLKNSVESPYAEVNSVVIASFVDYLFRVCGAELLQQTSVPPSIIGDKVLGDGTLSSLIRYMKPMSFTKCCDQLKYFILTLAFKVNSFR